MELVSLSPFPAECLVWEADAGQASLTVVVKVTLRLVHGGEAVVNETQLPIAGDEPWDDNPTASLFRPSDRAPLKPRTDLLLVGNAYAPDHKPVESLVATMRIGDFTKSITVGATRLWTRGASGFVPGPPIPFETMPLRYERGPLTQDNPVGVDPAAPPMEGAAVAPVLAPVAPATFACFGPVAATWRPRRRLLGEAGRFWALAFETSGAGPAEPAPRALDFRFFNAAPPDQQTSLLRQRADIELVNLHPTHATLRSRLPALRPQVFRVGPRERRAVEVALRCDTVWIDGDRGLVCLVWRGLTDVPSTARDAIGTVFVVADPQGRRVRFDQVERAWREGVPIEATEPGAADALAVRHDAVRSRGEGEEAAGEAPAPPREREKDTTRAFGPGGSEGARAVLPFEQSGAHVAFAERPGGFPPERSSTHGTPFRAMAEMAAGGSLEQSGAQPAFLERSGGFASGVAKGATEPPPPMEPREADDLDERDERDEHDDRDDTHEHMPDDIPTGALPFLRRAPSTIPPPPAAPLTIPPPTPRPPQDAAPPAPPPFGMAQAGPLHAAQPPTPFTPHPATPLSPGVEPPPAVAKPAPVQVAIVQAASAQPAQPEPATPSITQPMAAKTGPVKPVIAKPVIAKPVIARPAGAKPAATPSKPPPLEAGPAGFDPKDVSVATYGAVSAELMIRRGERAKVLEAHDLGEPAWARIHAHWTAEMGRETARGESRLLAQFDAAYVETLGRLRKPIGVPEYAALLVAIERGEVDKQLAALSLSLSDLMRVQRVWTRRLADDTELGKVLGKAVEEARAAADRPA